MTYETFIDVLDFHLEIRLVLLYLLDVILDQR